MVKDEIQAPLGIPEVGETQPELIKVAGYYALLAFFYSVDFPIEQRDLIIDADLLKDISCQAAQFGDEFQDFSS